jgi:hypothetical protein
LNNYYWMIKLSPERHPERVASARGSLRADT